MSLKVSAIPIIRSLHTYFQIVVSGVKDFFSSSFCVASNPDDIAKIALIKESSKMIDILLLLLIV